MQKQDDDKIMLNGVDTGRMTLPAIVWWLELTAQDRASYIQSLYELETAYLSERKIFPGSAHLMQDESFADEKKKDDADGRDYRYR